MRHMKSFVIGLALLLAGVCFAGNTFAADKEGPVEGFKAEFQVDKSTLKNTGANPYFILQPGYKLFYKGGTTTLVITVTNDTKLVDGVETRVIEEREEKGGKLAEVSRNYFVIDPATSDLYYFGEDVDMYKDGKITDHEGSWLAGVNGAKFGMMMPGKPKVGDKFYQERAPKVALDRSEIVGMNVTIETPAGKFEKCLKTDDTSDLESGHSPKVYAPGIGLVKDAELELVKIEKPQ